MALDFASSTNVSLPANTFILDLNQIAFYLIPTSPFQSDEKEMLLFLRKMKELSSKTILWKNTQLYIRKLLLEGE